MSLVCSFCPLDLLLTYLRDLASIESAIAQAKKSTDKPTMINLKTTIGFGSLKAGGHDVHGAREYHQFVL